MLSLRCDANQIRPSITRAHRLIVSDYPPRPPWGVNLPQPGSYRSSSGRAALQTGEEVSMIDAGQLAKNEESRLGEAEEVFFEGHGGSRVELALSLALAATLIFAPLTIASIGRRFWLKYKFTNKRIIITNNSPLFKREIQLLYSDIKEVRTASRGLGAWGDMVIFTKRGETLELIGMERYQDLKFYIDKMMYTIK